MKRHAITSQYRCTAWAMLLCMLALLPLTATGRETYNFNSQWTVDYTTIDSLKHLGQRQVTLPHAWNEDETFRLSTFEMSTGVVWYRKEFQLPDVTGKRVFIEFEGARQSAEVLLNGQRLGLHENGVMAFGFELTPHLRKGKNLIEVCTDNRLDYAEAATGTRYQWNVSAFNINYGGLPKNVWLHITDAVYQTLPLLSSLGTTGTYVSGCDYDVKGRKATVHVESEVKNDTRQSVSTALDVVIEDMEGREVARFRGSETQIAAGKTAVLTAEHPVSGLHFWSWGYGYLYDVKTQLIINGKATDPVTTKTGFRKTAFKNGMIYLNDRVMMVHGYAQRTSNEWPGVGMSVPAWLSDYSNNLLVESGGNVVRWMHTCPWRQDVESCDRVGLIQAMPAGDAEHDSKGRQWQQRVELMADAIVYLRNSPSILFYECGNQRISRGHMLEMKQLRDLYDPYGGRAIGSREMLDRPEAEYGGEMLYVNKSDTKPMWMMEYCRDEALRFYWNSWSYPFHKEGEGPLFRGGSSRSYNHNNDEFVAETTRRWYEAWLERPGSGTKVTAGGVKIIFSDTQSHGRSADNYRVSGVVDPMRIEKDAFYSHQVMWDGWVDDLKPHTYIVGHWNYDDGFVVPVVYVVSNANKVVLQQDGQTIEPSSHSYRFLWTFKNVKYKAGRLQAIGYDKQGREVSRNEKVTAGTPHHLKLTAIENPTGWKADGADVALVQIEVVDAEGRRCPLDNRLIRWSVKGPAEYRGGVAKNKPFTMVTNDAALNSKSATVAGAPFKADRETLLRLNHALQDTLPVECGISRVMLRSLPKAGQVVVSAQADGMGKATVTLKTQAVSVTGGLATYKPADGLPSRLDRGETPATPSYKPWRCEVAVQSVTAGSGKNPELSCDAIENTAWESEGTLEGAWISYTLQEVSRVDDISLKLANMRSFSYPLVVYADGVEVWRGWTDRTLGFIHIPLKQAPAARTWKLHMMGRPTKSNKFAEIKELDARNDEKAGKGGTLKIMEAAFLRNL